MAEEKKKVAPKPKPKPMYRYINRSRTKILRCKANPYWLPGEEVITTADDVKEYEEKGYVLRKG